MLQRFGKVHICGAGAIWEKLRKIRPASCTETVNSSNSSFFHLWRLRQVRRLLGRDITANLVCLVATYYGNALLAGLPYAIIAPLQRVLNAAVRLVYGLRPRDNVSAATIELHWLPVEHAYSSNCASWFIIPSSATLRRTSRISFSRSPDSHLVDLSSVRPRGLTSKFQERVWSSVSGPSASQPQSRGTICRCTSAQPTSPIPLSGDWKLFHSAHFMSKPLPTAFI